jgi:hypothetical protein
MLRLSSISQLDDAGLRDMESAWDFSLPEMKTLERILQQKLDQRLQCAGKQVEVKILPCKIAFWVAGS